MKVRTSEYYNWAEDFQPEILKNLNELLVADGIEPLKNLHGGTFKDGKWGHRGADINDYRNYWHVYLELFGEGLSNDQFQVVYFDHPDNDWEYWYSLAEQFADKARSGYDHSDPKWACHLVTAVRKMLKDHNLITDPDGKALTIWWSW